TPRLHTVGRGLNARRANAERPLTRPLLPTFRPNFAEHPSRDRASRPVGRLRPKSENVDLQGVRKKQQTGMELDEAFSRPDTVGHDGIRRTGAPRWSKRWAKSGTSDAPSPSSRRSFSPQACSLD